MAAYVIAQLNVTDPEGFARYRDAVTEMVARYGGKDLVRGGATECLEGTWPASRRQDRLRRVAWPGWPSRGS